MVDRYRNYQPRYTQLREPKKKHHKRWLLLFVIAALVVGGKTLTSNAEPTKEDSPAPAAAQKPKPVIKADPISSTTWNDLGVKINALIAEQPKLDISVAVIDLNSNTSANYGIQDNFAGASTTKVLTAVAYLKKVEDGSRTLTQKVNGTAAQQQIKLMINQSNNDSWAALNKNLTYTALEAYAKSIGINSYKSKANTITASDEALLLKKLYKDELINAEHKALLLSYMQNTNNEAMIPKVLPAGATLYHKYGQLEDRLHDAAIIDYKQQPIVVVIYTKGGASDGSNYQTRVQLIQQFAQTVFDTVYTP